MSVLAGRLAGALVCLAMMVGAARAEDQGWLQGRWALKQDTSGNPRDYLDFRDGGEVIVIRPNGVRTHGLYLVHGDAVDMTFAKASGGVFRLHMRRDAAHHLTLHSQVTGALAVYDRIQAAPSH